MDKFAFYGFIETECQKISEYGYSIIANPVIAGRLVTADHFCMPYVSNSVQPWPMASLDINGHIQFKLIDGKWEFYQYTSPDVQFTEIDGKFNIKVNEICLKLNGIDP